ncbi:hypothetical protein [Martelella soudanensis]|uniref:hypothetical protein n=1 Tax=unclassified Martelella TaxID=2629616 RepID=UPI0015DDECF0|nr:MULTISPECIES: hypothetical protein [unclassified Martelella]
MSQKNTRLLKKSAMLPIAIRHRRCSSIQRSATDSAIQTCVTYFFTRSPWLSGQNQLPLVIEGVTFTDGVPQADANENHAA